MTDKVAKQERGFPCANTTVSFSGTLHD